MAFVQELLATVLLVLGALLLLIAGIGVVRMPDVFLRMSAVSKASSLGASLMLLAVALVLPELSAGVRAMAAVLFLFLTTPIAAHLIGRAAYRRGVPRWRGMVVDDFAAYEEQRVARRGQSGAQPNGGLGA
jgi:multicomponent Na+:H+ antiporter subunit G